MNEPVTIEWLKQQLNEFWLEGEGNPCYRQFDNQRGKNEITGYK